MSETSPTTLAGFLEEARRGRPEGPALAPAAAAAIEGVAAALLELAAAVAGEPPPSASAGPDGDPRLALLAQELLLHHAARSGAVAGVASTALEEPRPLPVAAGAGAHLLVVDPLDAPANLAVNAAAGLVFSLLPAPQPPRPAALEDFLQPGLRQVCAGYALLGPRAQLVLTTGDGVHGFTLDAARGELRLTHPRLALPEARGYAVDGAGEGLWDAPVRRYVGERRASGAEARWTGSLAADLHRVLLRGGVLVAPRAAAQPPREGGLALLFHANPAALLVEQAGGAASTGRARLLELTPAGLRARVPALLGSRAEVERLVRYHDEHARGVAGPDRPYRSPLFATRSLFTEPW